jgi:low temperature requirement protein LtrA
MEGAEAQRERAPMHQADAGGSLLRRRAPHEHARVTYVELFFDLVFVFAVTQLSHALLADLTPLGLLHAALLMMAVWWVWIYTSWVTNWLDPERAPVRLMLFALMLAGLVLSTSIPQAFGSRGLAFAGAYAFMQVGRCLFMLWALRGESPGNFRNFLRIAAWLTLAGAFWIAGGLAEGGWRLGLWLVALAIEYVSPSAGFWTPGLGRSTTADWDISGVHMAERCALFIIIALGESVLVTGATFAGMSWTPTAIGAFLTAFVGSVAMWWIYFNIGAERAGRHIAASGDPGRVARFSYTYLHLPLVARHDPGCGGRRAGARPSHGPHRCQDRGRADRGACALPPRQPDVQARHRRQPGALAHDRARPARGAGARRGPPGAAGPECRHHGGAGPRRRLGDRGVPALACAAAARRELTAQRRALPSRLGLAHGMAARPRRRLDRCGRGVFNSQNGVATRSCSDRTGRAP